MLNDKILCFVIDLFVLIGGLKQLVGNLGCGVIKVLVVVLECYIIEVFVCVFVDQEEVKVVFKCGEFIGDIIVVVWFQGLQVNGMLELYLLMFMLVVLQDWGLCVVLVMDGCMLGVLGKVLVVIYLLFEVVDGGLLVWVQDGDIIWLDVVVGMLECLVVDFDVCMFVMYDFDVLFEGMGCELFCVFCVYVGCVIEGVVVVVQGCSLD